MHFKIELKIKLIISFLRLILTLILSLRITMAECGKVLHIHPLVFVRNTFKTYVNTFGIKSIILKLLNYIGPICYVLSSFLIYNMLFFPLNKY